MSDARLDALLSAVEQTELKSLVWGYVDGSLSRSDILALSPEFADDVTAFDEVLQELEARLLLIEVGWDADGPRYRSRFAETLRLLARVRQILPGKRWDVAPELVSDFRVSVAPRLVPARTFGANEVRRRWTEAPGWTEAATAAATRYFGDTEMLLSEFQAEVGFECFSWPGRDQGVVVTAGTGAGKTLAYYLPVAIEVSRLVERGVYWTKSVSVYPRIELLKDQMSEVLRITRQVGQDVASRPIRLGSLFDAVPEAPAFVSDDHWPRMGGRHVCPFLRCPECSGSLWWHDEDRKVEREVLRCGDCGTRIGDNNEIGLTRRSLRESPPDLLFVSAEMVNQRLSDARYRPLLGVDRSRDRRARYLLLDEIHTYGGIVGAQVAGVLRRYRHAVNRPMFVVGLSATLRDAPEFLAELTGLPVQQCREVSPKDEDLVAVSAAYQVVLKASSANRTSVLSTSIQAIFLLARMLDNEQIRGGVSGGFAGSRAFVFLDTLDVTNRLFHDLGDAERGYSRSVKGPLAALRPRLAAGEDRRRDLAGQAWGVAEQIHGPLGQPLVISRTSSQDVGVDASSDVVVATASLEVGYNDPHVGAVIQHRGPKDLATFVQRRGRAGRPVMMRPWMVTVLSEYGPDRLTFQLYEQLFDPALPPRHLPIGNRYVLRIQAVFALFDWISLRLPGARSIWGLLAAPPKDDQEARRQELVLELLDQLGAGDEDLRASASRHIASALQLSDQDTDALLWSPPRSLWLEVVPTLRRRLATRWVRASGELDRNARWHPLPEYVPRALFDDLLTPEVQLVTPPGPRAQTDEWLPVAQALREFAPGRVSRRLAAKDPMTSHWVVPAERLDVSKVMPGAEIIGVVDLDGISVPCHRPWAIVTEKVPPDVSKTSFGSMDWRSSFEVAGAGLTQELPNQASVSTPFGAFSFHLHSRRDPLTVWRYAGSAQANVVHPRGVEEPIEVTFVDDEGPVAVGFVQDVDAFRVALRIPAAEEFERSAAGAAATGWRSAFVRHVLTADPVLSARANRFLLSWLADALVVALTRAALKVQEPGDALAEVQADMWSSLRGAVTAMHSLNVGPAPEDEQSGDSDDDRVTKLEERLRELLDDETFASRLTDLAMDALRPTPPGFAAWARGQYVGAAGDTLLAACASLLPNRAGAETLVVDVTDDGSDAAIWISETVLGGGGVIEAVAEAFAADPWRMVRAIEAALATSDLESLADGLSRTAEALASDADLQELAAAVRVSSKHRPRQAALRAFASELSDRGIVVDQSLLVALNQRVFRAGTGPDWDGLLHELDQVRERVSAAVGFWPELRLLALAIDASASLSSRLTRVVEGQWGQDPDLAAIRAAVLSGLWPAAPDVRPSGLQSYNPFAPDRKSDPGWLRAFRTGDGEPIVLGVEGWAEAIHGRLAAQGVAMLSAPAKEARALRIAIQELVATPIDVGYLRVYPALASVDAQGPTFVARFEVRELA